MPKRFFFIFLTPSKKMDCICINEIAILFRISRGLIKIMNCQSYYLLDFSTSALRGAEIWHIWKPHFLIEWFWKMLKSVFKIKEMRLRDLGLYTGLLIKVLAYLLAFRLQTHREFSHLSITQLMRKIQREYRLQELMEEHFHLPNFLKPGRIGQRC